MSKYELVLSRYDSIDDKYIDTVVKLSEITDMNDLIKIDHYISNFKESDLDMKIRKENNIDFHNGRLKIRFFVGDEARYYNPIYDNDIIYNCTMDSHNVKHSNKKTIDDVISTFKTEKYKLIDLLRSKKTDEINRIFPYGGKFKDMLIDYINLGEIDLLYEQDIINEFTNYTTFRSWVSGNLNKNRQPIQQLKELKEEIVTATTNEIKTELLTESERLQKLNNSFTVEDNEEFLTDEEMDNAGYGTR